ncbi:MAG: cysteine desulfurase family protein [Phycisphaerales bacterium]
MIYLDNNATTQPAAEVVTAVHDALTQYWANPSSVHRAGQLARRQLELARSALASFLGCKEREIIFTSGATESNNLALSLGTSRSTSGGIITTTTEHAAIREPVEQLEREGRQIFRLPIGPSGLVNPDDLKSTLDQHADQVALVSIHYANNETGVIQPIPALAQIAHDHNVLFHSDATQAVGKIPVNLADLPVDALSFSAHKFHGPKGAGALFLRHPHRLQPQIRGGPQERQRRGGTENLPGILGLAVAARLAQQWLQSDGPAKLAALRDHFEQTLLTQLPGATVNAGSSPRLCNTSSIAFRGLEAEAVLIALSERGVYASAGAACSSGSLEPSPVLLAMGIEEPLAHGSLRFSLSRDTTPDEINQAINHIVQVITKLRQTLPI